MSNLQQEFDKFKGRDIKTIRTNDPNFGPMKQLDPNHQTAKDLFALAAQHNINTIEVVMRGSPRPGNASQHRARITIGYNASNSECIADIEIG